MRSLNVVGGIPLNGSVDLSGSSITASKLILASLFTIEPVIISGVPKVPFIEDTLNLIASTGASYEWLDENRLLINTSGVSSFRIPFEEGVNYPNTLLLVAPLVFRFGKAILPKSSVDPECSKVLDQFISAWKALGMLVTEDSDWINIALGDPKSTNINIKDASCLLTENALISSIYIGGKTTITNASEDTEIDSYISFLNSLGAFIERVEPTRIEIIGQTMFKGTSFIDKIALAPFVNVLTNIGANYEFSGDSLTVWHGGEELEAVDITTRPAPGVLHDWFYALAVLLTQVRGVSSLTAAKSHVDLGFFSDLNRMGANIVSVNESSLSVANIGGTSDTKRAPPDFFLEISGPSKLSGVTLDMTQISSGIGLLLAALTCQGKSLVRGSGIIDYRHENLVKKLVDLGAQIS